MTRVLLANNRASRDTVAPAPSIDENGLAFEWRMFFNNNSEIADASSLEELVDVFIPGYLELGVAERVEARVKYARGLILRLKTSILVSLTPEDREGLEPWELAFLEADPEVITWEKDDDETIKVWKSDFPVMLIDVFYSPYTDTPRPISKHGDFDSSENLVFFKAIDDKSFLDSLKNLGMIEFGHPSSDNRRVQRRVRA